MLFRSNFIMSIKNPYNGTSFMDKKGDIITTKEQPLSHGLGLSSIKRSVEKYKGTIKIDTCKNIFQLMVFIPQD